MSSRGRDDPDEFTQETHDYRRIRIVVDPSVEQGCWLLLNGHCMVFGKIEDLSMRGHNAHRNLRVGSSAFDSAHCDDTYVFFAVPKSMYILPLPINCSTASVNCHFDGLGKTAHVKGNGLDAPKKVEETWCAVARGIRLRSRTLRAQCHARSSEGRLKILCTLAL